MWNVVSLHRESEVSNRAALDQRSTSANESVEEAWRISSTPRVNWLLLHKRKMQAAHRLSFGIISSTISQWDKEQQALNSADYIYIKTAFDCQTRYATLH